jgi:multidrug resistance protein
MGEILHKNQAEGTRKTIKPLVLASVMLAMFMGAIEATIVSTAMPAIVADLGGFTLYSWVFSSYLLMNSVTVLIYGKLSDLFGRKPILFFGIIIFLIGSILCGFADSMKMLIIFRLIQGFGAGAVMPIVTTIVGDIYTKEERAKIQGYLSSVWGISAVVGPAIGGFLVQYSSWHYVFWMNIPLGILAILGLMFFLHENVEKKSHKIDYPGAIL